jgi:hypothetical protein
MTRGASPPVQNAGCLAVVIDYMGPSPEIVDAAALFGTSFID